MSYPEDNIDVDIKDESHDKSELRENLARPIFRAQHSFITYNQDLRRKKIERNIDDRIDIEND